MLVLLRTQIYEKHLKDDKISRDIVLMFMETDIEILFQEYTCAKIMFDAFTRASSVCFKAYT